jgi:gluconolactonase
MATARMGLEQFTSFVEGLDHPEGVACGPDGLVYAGGEAGQIYRVTLDGKSEQIGTTGGFVLGLCLDGYGNVYACDIGKHAVFRITPRGEVSVYSNGSAQRKMVTPNYPVFDRNGNLYVTDSGHWKQNDGCIFRVRPGGATEVVTTAVGAFPNGMTLGPDGASLYVVLSLLPGVVRCPIKPDGSVGDPQPVVTIPNTVPDGVAFDAAGNLIISCYTPDAIYCLTASGELQLLAEDWQSVTLSSPTNIAFCGDDRRTLVVASLARWHLCKATMPAPGHPLCYPKL